MRDHASIQVHDGFYADPYAVRAFALDCSYRRPPAGTFPGYHSSQSHPRAKETFHRIGRLISEHARPDWARIERTVEFWGWPAAGLFTLLLESQQDTVHFHRRSGRWAAVCYLSRPEHCVSRPGVTLFRHAATELDAYMDADEDQYARVMLDAEDRTRWEPLVTVPMAFNRLVVFDARYFHAASDGFGTSVKDGRLAQIFTFDFA